MTVLPNTLQMLNCVEIVCAYDLAQQRFIAVTFSFIIRSSSRNLQTFLVPSQSTYRQDCWITAAARQLSSANFSGLCAPNSGRTPALVVTIASKRD